MKLHVGDRVRLKASSTRTNPNGVTALFPKGRVGVVDGVILPGPENGAFKKYAILFKAVFKREDGSVFLKKVPLGIVAERASEWLERVEA